MSKSDQSFLTPLVICAGVLIFVGTCSFTSRVLSINYAKVDWSLIESRPYMVVDKFANDVSVLGFGLALLGIWVIAYEAVRTKRIQWRNRDG